MCGIAGWISFKKQFEEMPQVITKMTRILSHRGPDSEGIWLSPNAALGHRRLAVMDVERGKQPMIRVYNDCRYVIVYNGELYNTLDLKTELESFGYKFTTTCDTEVLLYSYIHWGYECLSRLNGIFAFGIWDESRYQFILARDRFGVKPLFYSYNDNYGLVFGSEIKALLQHPFIKPHIDKEGLCEIFALSPSRTPGHGVFKNISELLPGHFMILSNSNFINKCYWKLESHSHEDSIFETIGKVRFLVSDSIERQLISDVPICTFLSGGLDSSIITALAAKDLKNRHKGFLNTFSINYVDNEKFFKESSFQPNSDAPYAQKMSKYYKTIHDEKRIDTLSLADTLKEAVKGRDLPGMADIDSSLWLFCRDVKKTSTVALSGECADEIFGGYPWFHKEELLNNQSFPWMINISEKLDVLNKDFKDYLRPKEYILKRYYETLHQVPYLPGENDIEKRRREIFYLNITWFMSNLLERKDRMSMAHGLEVRVPFCDHRLAQYVWNIPWDIKMYNNREKGLLRKAMSGILPEDILWRKKSPYPKTHHPDYEEAVKKLLLEVIQDSSSPILQFIDKNAVYSLIDEASDYGKPWFGQLMARPQLSAFLVQVDYWMREYNVQLC